MSFLFRDELERLAGKVTNEEFDTVKAMVFEDLVRNGWYSRETIRKAFESDSSGTENSVVQGEILSSAVIALRVLRRLEKTK